MSKIKAILKSVNWLRVVGWVFGLSSVIYLFGGLALLNEYGLWVDMELFAPLFYCGLSFGMFLWLSFMSSVVFDDAKLFEKMRECEGVKRGLEFISDCAELKNYVSCAVPCPVCNSRAHLRFHIVHESDLETVYDFGCNKCGVCGYDAHDKTMAVAFWNRCVKEKAGHIRRAVFMTSKEYAEELRRSGRYSDAEE